MRLDPEEDREPTKVVADKPPAAGMGRPKGAVNKTTAAVKEAMLAVFDDLQLDAAKTEMGVHPHFKAWATSNPTAFYKLWSKLLPAEIKADVTGVIASTFDLTSLTPDQKRALAAITLPTDS